MGYSHERSLKASYWRTLARRAVADALLGERDFATSLRSFVRRHPHGGYGGMFIDWAFSDDAPAYGSWGNGAPMRAAGESTLPIRRCAVEFLRSMASVSLPMSADS
jgi:hypothetical protein